MLASNNNRQSLMPKTGDHYMRTLKLKQFQRELEYHKYRLVRKNTGHAVYRNPQGKVIAIPIHKTELNAGLTARLLKEMKE